MIHARCLHRSNHILKLDNRRLTHISNLSRNFSSISIRTSTNSTPSCNRLAQSGNSYRSQEWKTRYPNGLPTTRFASTASTPPPVADIQPTYAPPSEPVVPPGEDFLSTSLDDVTANVSPPVYEHLGFLKEMGLEYGWGPTAMIETLLEHIHIYTGMPWWVSVTLTVLTLRAAMFKFYIDAADTNARLAVLKPYLEPIKQRIKTSQVSQDYPEIMRARHEMKALHKSAGIKYYKIFLPFLQMPLGLGTFRLCSGMGHLPVPGLETGGLLWVKDLTISDPYFILPLATAAAYHFTFKFGGESGTRAAELSPTMHKIFLYVLPTTACVFMAAWPGVMQLSFFISALLSLIQSSILRQPWFRNMLGIQPLPTPAATTAQTTAYSGTISRYQPPASSPLATEKKGMLGGAFADIKGAIAGVRKQADSIKGSMQQPQKGRRTAAELKHAKAYEEKRQRELAQEKFLKAQEAQEERETELEKKERQAERKLRQKN